MENNELYYLLALKKVPNVGDKNAKELIAYCGSAEQIFKMTKQKLEKIPSIGPVVAQSIKQFKQFDLIENELDFVKKNNIQIIPYSSEKYPYRLKSCDDSPIFLFAKGITDLNNPKIISVVGTRNSSSYGREFCLELMSALKNTDALVVSGLAMGIDTSAHKEALNYGLPTAAVLAHGLHTIAPPSNYNLSQQIIENGTLLTEHFSIDHPLAENFPKRNRIVAGICDALVIVESGIKGGAMITADLAWSYDREVFALPGKITDTFSQGCIKLINNNRAICIQNATSLVKYLGWETEVNNATRIEIENKIPLSTDEKVIFKLLREKEKQIDDLHFESGMPLSMISMLLLNLEFKNLVVSKPGKIYKLKN